MPKRPELAQLEQLAGKPEWKNLLGYLIGGKAYTACELGGAVRLPVETIRPHLDGLVSNKILARRVQGPHQYYALARCEIADMLAPLLYPMAVREASRIVAPVIKTGPGDPVMRNARICYGHLAGDMGVHMFDSLIARKYLSQTDDVLALTDAGRHFIAEIGIDLGALHTPRRPMCKTCLDWSVRRSHLGGILGKVILDHLFALGWAHRTAPSRSVQFSVDGDQSFLECFPV